MRKSERGKGRGRVRGWRVREDSNHNSNPYLLPVMVSKTIPVGGLEIGKKTLEMPTENMFHAKQRMVLKLKAANMDLQLITTLAEHTQH